MGLALLYVCIGNNEDVVVPTQLRDRVRAAYAQLGLEEAQPIKKIQLHVYRNNGILMIDALNDDVGTTGAVAAGGQMSNETAQTILIRLNHLERTQVQAQVNITSSIDELCSFCNGWFRSCESEDTK